MEASRRSLDLIPAEHAQLGILLVGSYPLARAGLRRLVELEGQVDVLAEAASGEEALRAARQVHPALALIDMVLPYREGIAATHALTALDAATVVVALLSADEQPYRHALREAGVSIVVLRPGDKLLTVVPPVWATATS